MLVECLGQSSRIKLPVLIGRGRSTVSQRRDCLLRVHRDKCSSPLNLTRLGIARLKSEIKCFLGILSTKYHMIMTYICNSQHAKDHHSSKLGLHSRGIISNVTEPKNNSVFHWKNQCTLNSINANQFIFSVLINNLTFNYIFFIITIIL